MRVFVVLLPLLCSCGGKAWRQARQADTSTAYAAFVANNPTNAKAGKARRLSESMDWLEAQTLDTSTSYAAYLGAHPTSMNAEEAHARSEDRAWTEAVEDGGQHALNGYLVRHPGTAHAREAEERIEEAWYNDAKAGNTQESWGRYLVRYPVGRWATEAKAERERLAWDIATAANSRAGYESYLRGYPGGLHEAEAEAWISSSKVLTVQPVIVLAGTWKPDWGRRGVISRVQFQFDKGLVADLKRDFTILRTKVEDPKGGEVPHPHDTYGVEADVGLLVLSYEERAGRAFEPSGHATDITAVLSLYTPPTREAVWTKTFETGTPEKIYGVTLDALHASAIKELGGEMRTVAEDLIAEKRGAP